MAQQHHNLDDAIDDVGGYDDEGYEADDYVEPTSSRRRRSVGEATGRRSRPAPDATTGPVRRSDRRIDQAEDEIATDGPGFVTRLLVAMVGGLAFLAGNVALAWNEIHQGWTSALADAGFPAWQGYGVMGCVLLGGLLVVGIIAALHDRSLWRVLLLGMVWTALAQLGAGYHARAMPAQPAAEDNVATGLAMTQTAVAPLMAASRANEAEANQRVAAKQAEVDELATRVAELETAATERQSELDSLRTASQQAQDTVADLQHGLTEAQAEAKRISERLEDSEAAVAELTATRDELQQRVESLGNDLEAAKTLNQSLTTDNERLQAEVAEWKAKAAAARQALKSAEAKAEALKSLSGGDE